MTVTDRPINARHASMRTDVDRGVAFVYRVALRSGLPPLAAEELCDRLVPAALDTTKHSWETRDDRWVSRSLATALRTRLNDQCDPRDLEAALAEAILLDELVLLPTRQRFTVWAAIVRGRPLAEIAAETGWSTAQVRRLLTAGLTSISRNTASMSTV
ncbi:hypothetical protein AB0N89_20255 [Amycolatopsis sp. NPDC089917]|uniref:hypothetical protein n=1 Tax=Amycolatopsis sp. NPDC089917 TaxID=3155187 RepID=UPI0034149894